MPITIQDIADQLGVSVSTVSKALNNYADVSSATRARVKKVSKELGYHPSAVAQSLRRQHTNKIGLILNYPIAAVAELFSQLIHGITLAAEREGINIILYTTVANKIEELTRISRAREVEGFILSWPTQLEETISLLEAENIPFVVVPRRVEAQDVSYVASDNWQGAYDLTNHLISLGHKRIGFTPLPELCETSSDRFNGYRQALTDAGLSYEEDLIIPITQATSSRVAAINQLLDLETPPTALFAFHDYVAIEALQIAKERGLAVPEDLSIAGFDGNLSAWVTSPPLTTVHQPMQEIGQRAVEILLSAIANKSNQISQEILPTRLAPQSSTLGTHTLYPQ